MTDYQTISALNQSTLKQILISPLAYIKAKEKQLARVESEEQHFVFGSMVDIMLTEPKENFDKKYLVVPDDIGVTDVIGRIIKGVYDDDFGEILEEKTLEDYREQILQHCNYEQYQSRWKDETRINKIIEQGSKYVDILKESGTRIIITESEYAKAVNCVMALRNDKYTSKYCQKKSNDPNIEIINKYIIEFRYHDLDFKGELDRVIIDHKNKTITPIDFKTTSKSVLNFEKDFWYYRYDFQAAVYTWGLSSDSNERFQKLYEDGYRFKAFLYIVVETYLNNPPMVFRIRKSAIDIGLFGGEREGKKYQGFIDAIKRYKYANKNNAWEYPMEYYQNEGMNNIMV